MEKEIHSERLHYRNIVESDGAALHAILSDPSITEPAGYQALGSEEEFREFFQNLAEDENGTAILLDQKVIGYFRIFPEKMEEEPYKGKKCAGVGFVLGKEYHRKGYGTENCSGFGQKRSSRSMIIALQTHLQIIRHPTR